MSSIEYNDTELNEFSPVADVLECAINAILQLSDNEWIYDDDNDTSVLITDAQKIVAQLREADE